MGLEAVRHHVVDIRLQSLCLQIANLDIYIYIYNIAGDLQIMPHWSTLTARIRATEFGTPSI